MPDYNRKTHDNPFDSMFRRLQKCSIRIESRVEIFRHVISSHWNRAESQLSCDALCARQKRPQLYLKSEQCINARRHRCQSFKKPKYTGISKSIDLITQIKPRPTLQLRYQAFIRIFQPGFRRRPAVFVHIITIDRAYSIGGIAHVACHRFLI